MHIAPAPQEPGHGSLHFSLMQALLLVHSALIVHSGRQFGGDPIYSDKQEQDGMSLMLLQTEFGPHGDGTQGFFVNVRVGTGSGAIKVSFYFMIFISILRSYVVLDNIW